MRDSGRTGRIRRDGGDGRQVVFAMPSLRESFTLRAIQTCVGVYVLLAVLNLLGAWEYDSAFATLGLSREGLSRGHVWQVVSSPFVHADVQHLVFNMLSLAFLGGDVERRLGARGYVVFSAICAASAMAGFLLLGSATAPCVGCSGIIYGVLAASAVLYPDRVIHMFWVFPMKMKWAACVLGLMALFLTIQPGQDRIAHSAHLFGALAGFVYIRFWRRWHTVPATPIEGAFPKPLRETKRQAKVARVPDEI